jgi:hypothetical protein
LLRKCRQSASGGAIFSKGLAPAKTTQNTAELIILALPGFPLSADLKMN